MNLHRLRTAPPPWLARALEAFEAGFTYPLGPERTFRISHGDDYPRFFRAIGAAGCVVAEDGGRVLGCLAFAVRRLALPSGEDRPTAYLADLKIAPEARGGLMLRRLIRQIEDEVRAIGSAFGVVMGGSRVTPANYTGRAGVPAFSEVARIAVLRISAHPPPAHAPAPCQANEESLASVYRRLSLGRFACPGGNPLERSRSAPVDLVFPDACGRLEDTRQAKRLIADDGEELLSAHLSHFACANPRAGARLIETALTRAAARGFPALFAAVPEGDAPGLCERLAGREVVVAPASVFAAGLAGGAEWNINTAEI
jgi:hypothetical protein